MPSARPSSPRRPRRPAERAALTRERIAQAALHLIDEDGLDGCTMRRLGARLGVEAMALYHHFPDKQQLLQVVTDQLLAELDLPPRGQVPRLERLRRIIRSWRAISVRHPNAFALLAAWRLDTPRSLDVQETVFETLADLGLDATESARWFRLFACYASGAGLADVASRSHPDDTAPLRLESAPAQASHPHLSSVAPHLLTHRLDAVFEFGLDVLIEALAEEVTGRRGEQDPV